MLKIGIERNCSRKECENRYVVKTAWHFFCNDDCQKIDFAERKKKELNRKALKEAQKTFKK